MPRVEPVASGVGALHGLDGLAGAEAPGTDLEAVLHEAFAGGMTRVEAEIGAEDRDTRRMLQRAGLRPEGLARGRAGGADGMRLARLASDPPPGTPESFVAMLDATLPLKRVIAQGLIRNARGEILMCELTYKRDWDLPGGVCDPLESPAQTLAREVSEELAVSLPVGELLAIDWLPPYKQWRDAVLLVFDLGVHDDLAERVQREVAEIRAVHWVPLEQVGEHAAPYVVRLVQDLLRTEPAGAAYLEDGRGAAPRA